MSKFPGTSHTTNSKTKVLVVGSGGVGTMVAYALETGGLAEVTAVLRSNYKTVTERGFSINSIEHGHEIREWRPSTILNTVPTMRLAQDKHVYSYLVVTTKNIPDASPTVVDLIAPAVTPKHTVIVLIQNGMDIDKPIRQRFLNNTILSGVSLIGANETSSGVVLHNEPDICKIGVFCGSDVEATVQQKTQAQTFIDLYNACGKVMCLYDGDVEETRWKKLVYNASFNSVSAALGMNVTQMRLSDHIINDLVRPIMQEIVAIAFAAGYRLPDSVVEDMIVIDSLESWCMPSMGQDVAKGNLIEFENIVGEPLRKAQELNVPCPTLTVMYGILRGIQTRTKLAKGLLKFDLSHNGNYTV